jgi:hypothetical protein
LGDFIGASVGESVGVEDGGVLYEQSYVEPSL